MTLPLLVEHRKLTCVRESWRGGGWGVGGWDVFFGDKSAHIERCD